MILEVLVPLLVGLAIFLFGMRLMELAMNLWAGPYLQNALNRFTETPLRGMIAGAVITAMLQSSSAITVIAIGLVNSGLLTFSRTLGIILGTNIGTCLTTELIGLNLSKYGSGMLVASSVLWIAASFLPAVGWIVSLRYASLAVVGFSCVLAGVEVMQTIVPVLQARGLFSLFLEYAGQSLFWGVLAGMALTAVIQSSAATIAMAMSFVSLQAISEELGIAIALGANVGTCATGLLASIGSSRAGQKVAWAHLLLNAGGVLLFFPFISGLHALSSLLSATPAAQLAHAQTIFNIACSLIALPFCYLRIFQRP